LRLRKSNQDLAACPPVSLEGIYGLLQHVHLRRDATSGFIFACFLSYAIVLIKGDREDARPEEVLITLKRGKSC
jgi:hypothetical protein